jgi:hypothetical protein
MREHLRELGRDASRHSRSSGLAPASWNSSIRECRWFVQFIHPRRRPLLDQVDLNFCNRHTHAGIVVTADIYTLPTVATFPIMNPRFNVSRI